MATGDILAVRIASATAHNGWVAEIDIDNLATGGTYAFGLGSAHDPSGAKIVFSVTSPGYDDTGSLTTIARTVYGTYWIRKPYPSDASADESTSGGTLTVRVALSDYIYDTDASITVSIASGVYTNGTANAAVSGLSVTNNSTVTYAKAIVIGRWASLPFRRLTSTVDVEFVAFQTFGRSGRPVRAVKFIVSDGTHTDSQIVTSMTLATVPSGMPPIPVYACTLSTAAFTQGSDLVVQAVAYPWVGDALAVLDTGTSVTNAASLHAQAHLCDKTGAYLAPYVYVDASSGVDPGVVSTNTATASASPYATIWEALKGLRDYINTNASRSNSLNGGVVRLKAGDYAFGRTGSVTAMTAASAAIVIETDPAALPTFARLRAKSSSAQNILCKNVRLRNLTVQPATADQSNYLGCDNSGTDCLMFDGATIRQDTSATTSAYIKSNVLERWFKDTVHIDNGVTVAGLLARSCTLSTHNIGGFTNTACVLGNVWINDDTHTATNAFMVWSSAQANVVFAYNQSESAGAPLFNPSAAVVNIAVVQNVSERTTNGSQPGVAFTDIDVTNALFWSNTFAANRVNLEVQGATLNTFINISLKNNVFYYWASKQDTYGTPNASRVGGWSSDNGVGCQSNINYSPTFAPRFGGLFYSESVAPDFVDDASVLGDNSGNGDYRLQGSSPAYALVPTGGSVLPYDIQGTARNVAGGGSAGAYEMNPPTSGATLVQVERSIRGLMRGVAGER